METATIGVIGLGVMGQGLCQNLVNNNFTISVYDNDTSKVETFFSKTTTKQKIIINDSLNEFISSLSSPRKILLMIPAGEAIDSLLDELIPQIDANDIIIDAGNSWFKDTERRCKKLKDYNIKYIGMGVSGGEKGALLGPSMMLGGDRSTVETHLLPIFKKIAAQSPAPCVAHVGQYGAGHFVKMIHNGIEYALMQLLAEVYDIARKVYGIDNNKIKILFEKFNETELNSYLTDITARIFSKTDSHTKKPLIDLISDTAKSKGTGSWTLQSAIELNCPIPTISAAVDARNISALCSERQKLKTFLSKENYPNEKFTDEAFTMLYKSMLTAKITAYAQGMHLLSRASDIHKFDLELSKIANIWRGGCIIRSSLLENIAQAYQNGNREHLISAPYFQSCIKENITHLRQLASLATQTGIPIPAFSASISYLDSLQATSLPTNLIQAQRDFFGSHSFERVDQPGTFHELWEN